jgi:DNA invertase Pin-like site-specific DNA recombinase
VEKTMKARLKGKQTPKAPDPLRVPRVIGYLRVSTQDQDLEKNKADILRHANEKGLGCVEWIEEKVSGMKDWRKREIAKAVDLLQAEDWLLVPEISRLGRSTLDVLTILGELKAKDVNVFAVKGSWCLNGTIESKVFLTMMSLFAEIERDLISARTKEGLKARRAQGVKLGRPKGPGKSKLDEFKPEIIALLQNGSSKAFVAKRYNTTQVNLYNWLKQNKIDSKPIIKPLQ